MPIVKGVAVTTLTYGIKGAKAMPSPAKIARNSIKAGAFVINPVAGLKIAAVDKILPKFRAIDLSPKVRFC